MKVQIERKGFRFERGNFGGEGPMRCSFGKSFAESIPEEEVVGLAEVGREEQLEGLGLLRVVGEEPSGFADSLLLPLQVVA